MAKTLADFVRAARERTQEVDADTLNDWLEAGDDLLLVDVREPEEFAAGHLPGAVNVPRGVLEGAADPNYKHRHPQLCQARERRVVVYCQTGGRSAMAAATLQEMGFGEVWNLAGGIECWEGEDYPLESGEATKSNGSLTSIS